MNEWLTFTRTGSCTFPSSFALSFFFQPAVNTNHSRTAAPREPTARSTEPSLFMSIVPWMLRPKYCSPGAKSTAAILWERHAGGDPSEILWKSALFGSGKTCYKEFWWRTFQTKLHQVKPFAKLNHGCQRLSRHSLLPLSNDDKSHKDFLFIRCHQPALQIVQLSVFCTQEFLQFLVTLQTLPDAHCSFS